MIDIDPTVLVTRSQTAFARLHAQMMAIPAKELPTTLNVDLEFAVSRALGVASTVKQFRADIERCCLDTDLAAVDDLEERAFALLAARAISDVQPPEASTVEPVLHEVQAARRALRSTIDALIDAGLVPADHALDVGVGARGSREIADAVLQLAALVRKDRLTLAGRIPIDDAALDRYQHAAEKLLELLAQREAASTRNKSEDLRLRALALLERAYGEARRAVVYLRWKQGDADTLVPALRSVDAATRKRRRGSDPHPGDAAVQRAAQASATVSRPNGRG